MALISCRECGKEVSDQAKTCPNCGAPVIVPQTVMSSPDDAKPIVKKKGGALKVVLIVLAVVIVVGVAGRIIKARKGPVTVDETSDTNTELGVIESTPVPEQTEFSIGDTVKIDDINVTLVSVTASTGNKFYSPSAGNKYVMCEFIIENNSSNEIAISSLLCFDAYFDDFSTGISITAQAASDLGSIDGVIAAGRKLTGAICYEVDEDFEIGEIIFTPTFWRNRSVTFKFKNN